eukprot:CAMPEP_0113654092 /NCGR_PEP_ID=MMETSP0017_2-20120614/28966_1 /TAXON_ID=2856 /ORGANISM="Cylindrotheca closterium" /LENGTH=545 /DNA_ID=CAMNT_0000567205 /DNA_START=1829 /DNA_END=3466 /DNA_ORIENTATION=+ /assembly_acc=CAM_ASM_000147
MILVRHPRKKESLSHKMLQSAIPPMQETHTSYIDLWEELWSSHIPTHSKKRGKASEEEIERRLLNLTSELSSNSSSRVDNLNLMFELFPYPKHRKSVSKYNEAAYSRLISKLIQAKKERRKFKVVASGGSTTAGGGSQPIPQKERYYARLGDNLNILLSNIAPDDWDQTVQVIGQGHGTRNSLHSAVLFDSFIPSDVDLLLWEFSINDAAELNEDLITRNSKLNFLPWIHEVGKMKQPPVVILIYYWDTPYHHDNATMTIVGRSFASHGDISRQFNFVAGHINMGAYIDELKLSSCWDYVECPFLNDVHHASVLGHLATAFLLLSFLSPIGHINKETPQKLLTDTEYEWSCGVDTAEKRILKQVITYSATGWKSPAGGWTLDLPVVDLLTPRRLISGPGVTQIEIFGRIRPVRQDRQRCTPLSHCDVDPANSFSVVAPIEPLKDIRVLLLSFKYNEPLIDSTDIIVKLNASNTTADGTLVPMRVEKEPSIVQKWPCHLSNTNTWGTRTDVYWFIFEKPQLNVRSVELCQPTTVEKTSMIQSILLW